MRRFVSKVDWWLGVLLALLPLVMVTATIGLWTSGKSREAFMGLAFVVLVALLYKAMVFPLYYELTQEYLLVRFGWIRVRIPYEDIVAVEPSNNPLSSPALSLDRLHVRVKKGFGTLISPRDKHAFLDELSMLCPHLQRTQDALTPTEHD